MSDYRIVFQQEGGAEAQLVRDRLDMHNIAATGEPRYYPVNLFLKSSRGETMGGLLGGVWGGWLHIGYLWVDRSARGKRWARTPTGRLARTDHADANHQRRVVAVDRHLRPRGQRRGRALVCQPLARSAEG